MKRLMYAGGLIHLVADPDMWCADRIAAMLVGPGYVPTRDDITTLAIGSEDIVAGPIVLRNRSRDGLSLSAGNVTFRGSKKDAPYNAIVIFCDTGSEDTSTLLAYLEQEPGASNGGEMTVVWAPSRPLLAIPETV